MCKYRHTYVNMYIFYVNLFSSSKLGPSFLYTKAFSGSWYSSMFTNTVSNKRDLIGFKI